MKQVHTGYIKYSIVQLILPMHIFRTQVFFFFFYSYSVSALFSKVIKYLKLRLVLFKMYLTTWKENKAQIKQLVRGAAPRRIAFTPHRLTLEREINLGTPASITPGAALGTKH